MKKINLMILFCGFLAGNSFSQIHFQVFGGVSPQSKNSSAGLIVNRTSPHDEFVFNVTETGPQYFGGIKMKMEWNTPFFVNAGITYTKANYNYVLSYTLIDVEHPVSEYNLAGSEHLLVIPVNMGVHLGQFDATSGLKIMQSISTKSELMHLPGFQHDRNSPRFGWQGGIGYTIFDTKLGIEFDSEFSRVGKGMYVNGQSLELMHIPGQFIFTIQRNF